ncbi:hypothetical protein BDW02DRAFT_584234 [Decorospora gaudefroyi]|uniref:Uncharacterized protein n=1 Tax=Decorospora gaudefroyi TaxID=184978 RepID=A0A6A5K2S4_9PLEO|nr:hypothetical protein BDW02DRAFT_584234 [Decorospora gaudefroyi]
MSAIDQDASPLFAKPPAALLLNRLSKHNPRTKRPTRQRRELDKTLLKDAPDSLVADSTKLYNLCFDTLRLKAADAVKVAEDNRQQCIESDGQVVNLIEQLRQMKGDAYATVQGLKERAILAERRSNRLGKRKDTYKKSYEDEYNAHAKAREEIARLKATTPEADPSDPDSNNSEGPISAPRPRGRRPLHNDRTGLPLQTPLTTPVQRRSKQPEPAVFEGPTGTKASTYQKWKLDMLSWFRAHAYTFENNEEEKLDYIRMKTSGVA